MKLQGRVAIVSGGGGAIGRAIALKLAAEGADIAVVDVNAETAEKVADEVRAMGRRSLALAMDIRSYEAVTAGVNTVAETFGGIDIVVNSAGGSARSRMGRFEGLDMEVLDWILDVNLRGPLYIIRAALPHLIQRNAGKIVNIASIVALGGKAGCVDYSAAKGGILSATKSLAIEVGKYNINVNCVSPGLVQRPDQLPADEAAFAKRFSYLNRICTQDDIAEAVLYLACPESDYITGQNIVVDGGRSLGLHGD
jgi:NAD(P)-dependent dehydrogenase (short-subunit alcohol dehydrogenase family)